MDATLQAALDFMGGKVQGMGGNCTAIVFDHGETETVFTSIEHEHTAPESLDEVSYCETYDKATGQPLSQFDTLAAPDTITRDDTGQTGALRDLLLEMYGPNDVDPLPEPLECLRV